MIAPTWEQHCADYEPGAYSRYITTGGLKRDDNDLRLILTAAHLRLDRYDSLSDLPHRQQQRRAA